MKCNLLSGFGVYAAAVLIGGAVLVPSAHAALTYVDADETAGTGNTGPANAFTNSVTDDDLWARRAFGSSASIFQSGDGDGEDAPEISTVITGLIPGEQYTVYIHFWDGSGTNPDWNIRGGFTSGSTTLFANPADAPDIGAQDAVLASSLAYATAPTVMVEADRTMYAGLLGSTTADANGQITVFVDDLPSTIGVNNRSWYDGLSYEIVPEPASLGLFAAGMLALLARRRNA